MGKKVKQRRKRGKPNAQARQNKLTMIGITLVVCMLFGILLYSGNSLQNRIVANDEKQEQVEGQIQEQEKRTEDIEDLEKYMQTDEYMKSAAQDKLGLLNENEIIFKPKK